MIELPNLPTLRWGELAAKRHAVQVATVWYDGNKRSVPVFKDTKGHLWSPSVPGAPVLSRKRIEHEVLVKKRRNIKL